MASTAVLTVCYVFFAAGQGLSVGNILTYSLSVLPKEMKADGNAVCNTVQQLSGAIGTAAVAVIVAMEQMARPWDFVGATASGTALAFLMVLVMGVLQFLSMFFSFRKRKEHPVVQKAK